MKNILSILKTIHTDTYPQLKPISELPLINGETAISLLNAEDVYEGAVEIDGEFYIPLEEFEAWTKITKEIENETLREDISSY